MKVRQGGSTSSKTVDRHASVTQTAATISPEGRAVKLTFLEIALTLQVQHKMCQKVLSCPLRGGPLKEALAV
jgi:hypothetical protein